MLLDFTHTYPEAKIRYYASNMLLWVDSDATYLVLPNARSRYAGHFYLGSTPPEWSTSSYSRQAAQCQARPIAIASHLSCSVFASSLQQCHC